MVREIEEADRSTGFVEFLCCLEFRVVAAGRIKESGEVDDGDLNC